MRSADRDAHARQARGAVGVREHLVEVLVEALRVGAERERRVGLRVEIDHEHAMAVRGQRAREVHGGGGLPAAPLLVHDRDHAHPAVSPGSRGSRRRGVASTAARPGVGPRDAGEAVPEAGHLRTGASGQAVRSQRPGLGRAVCAGRLDVAPGPVGVDLALELRDLEHPLLTRNGVERGAILEGQHHVARRHQHDLGQRTFDRRQDLSQCTDRLPNPLDRDAGIDQSFGCLEGHQILERITRMAPGSPGTGPDQIGLVPVLELTARDPDDLRNVTHAIYVAGCSHVRGRPPSPLDTD